MLDQNVATMNSELHSLAEKWYTIFESQSRKDAAVIVQPYLEGIGPTLDISFLNGLDCFHPGSEGHELLAIGLWDSMLCTEDRANRCGIHFDKQMEIICPTAESVFYTGPDVVPGPPPAKENFEEILQI